MRWDWKKSPGQIVRHRAGFLWWPKSVHGQVRWLEYAFWVETWSADDWHRGWRPLFWENDPNRVD